MRAMRGAIPRDPAAHHPAVQENTGGRFVDYMLAGDGMAVARFEVIRDPEVSDHCPPLLEIGRANRSQSRAAAHCAS